MLSRARWMIIVPQSIVLASALFGGSAFAQEDRCTGTLCDLFYGSSPPSTPPPAAVPPGATPLMVPSSGFFGRLLTGDPQQPADAPAATGTGPAVPSRIVVQGGGLAGMMSGAPSERCTGTLCDLYYGGPPPEDPAAAQPAAVEAEAAADVAPRPGRPRHEYVEPREPPLCAPTPGDPWRCYR